MKKGDNLKREMTELEKQLTQLQFIKLNPKRMKGHFDMESEYTTNQDQSGTQLEPTITFVQPDSNVFH